jgi:hypothetical protein
MIREKVAPKLPETGRPPLVVAERELVEVTAGVVVTATGLGLAAGAAVSVTAVEVRVRVVVLVAWALTRPGAARRLTIKRVRTVFFI